MTGENVEPFETLLRTHERRVLRVAWRMLGTLEDAQDAAQEVFLKLHRHHRRVDRVTLEAWLYRTTVNCCYDALRKRRPEDRLAVEPAAPPETDLERDERRRLVSEGLKTLPERERAAVVLREIEGLSTAEVAAALGTSEVTVRSQVSMGKARLKKWLEGRR
ncbi:MAG: sigma-70 family RNA polymerase sigma factor [Bryobacteraceae bacterium]|nr:sigma-70 family RNA polymerase sigma factor [Bryobacteraceae bacterium]